MKTLIHNLNKWANSHTSFGIDALRIILGVFIFYKGIYFIENTDVLLRLIDPEDVMGTELFIAHYVAMAHLVGGLMIAAGFLTRLASIVQVPILIGAVLVNFTGEMMLMNLTEASFALVLLVFFTFFGSGKHSADYAMQLHI